MLSHWYICIRRKFIFNVSINSETSSTISVHTAVSPIHFSFKLLRLISDITTIKWWAYSPFSKVKLRNRLGIQIAIDQMNWGILSTLSRSVSHIGPGVCCKDPETGLFLRWSSQLSLWLQWEQGNLTHIPHIILMHYCMLIASLKNISIFHSCFCSMLFKERLIRVTPVCEAFIKWEFDC